jgi:hypothetical protein
VSVAPWSAGLGRCSDAWRAAEAALVRACKPQRSSTPGLRRGSRRRASSMVWVRRTAVCYRPTDPRPSALSRYSTCEHMTHSPSLPTRAGRAGRSVWQFDAP